MPLLRETLVLQEKDNWLSREALIPVKLALLLVNMVVIVFSNPFITLGFIAAYMLIYTSIGAFRLLYLTLIVYTPPVLIVALVNFALGELTASQVNLYLYSYSLLLSVLLVYSTSKRESLLKLLSPVKLDLAYSLTFSILEELESMIDSKIARGWKPGFNPLKYYIVIIDAIKLAVLRVRGVEDSLKARGME